MATDSCRSLTSTNTQALTMSSTTPSTQDTYLPSNATVKSVTPRINAYFQSPNIQVSIGSKKELWNLPRSLICAKIPYLQAILKPSSTERETTGINLHKEEPSTFSYVVDWMLTGDIPFFQEHDANKAELFLPLLEVHAFALRFKMQEFAELVKDKIKTCLLENHCLPTADEIHQVFNTGNDDTTLKKLIVKGLVDVFLAISPHELLGGLERWSKVIASHPEFTKKFLMAVKSSAVCLGVDAEDVKTAMVERKRKRQDEAEEEAEEEAKREALEAKRAGIIDLTDQFPDFS